MQAGRTHAVTASVNMLKCNRPLLRNYKRERTLRYYKQVAPAELGTICTWGTDYPPAIDTSLPIGCDSPMMNYRIPTIGNRSSKYTPTHRLPIPIAIGTEYRLPHPMILKPPRAQLAILAQFFQLAEFLSICGLIPRIGWKIRYDLNLNWKNTTIR